MLVPPLRFQMLTDVGKLEVRFDTGAYDYRLLRVLLGLLLACCLYSATWVALLLTVCGTYLHYARYLMDKYGRRFF